MSCNADSLSSFGGGEGEVRLPQILTRPRDRQHRELLSPTFRREGEAPAAFGVVHAGGSSFHGTEMKTGPFLDQNGPFLTVQFGFGAEVYLFFTFSLPKFALTEVKREENSKPRQLK